MKYPKIIRGAHSQPPPGTLMTLYLAPSEDMVKERLRTQAELRELATLPSGVNLPTEGNTLAERVTIGEKMDFAAGSGFTAYPILVNSGGYDSKTVGSAQQLSDENDLQFKFVGSDTEVYGFADLLKNRGHVALICDIDHKGNAFKLFGMKDIPAFFTEIKIDSGQKPGDKRELTAKIAERSGRTLKTYPVAFLHGETGLPLAP